MWAPITWSDEVWERRGAHYLSTVARLKPGVTQQAAMAEMVALARQIEVENPGVQKDFSANVVPFHEALVSGVRPQLLVLMGAVSFVLLIGCANVANLCLARAAARQRETAIRAAIGASRRHLVRQQLAESTVLGVLGGAVGLALASWGARLVPLMAPSADIPRLDEAGVDWRVALFTFALAMVASLAAGLVPGLQVTRANLNDVLKDGGKGSTTGGARARLRNGLFVAEVAFALLLLAGAGLTVKSLWRLLTVDTGLQADPVLTASVTLPRARYGSDTLQARFVGAALERLRAVPGVRAAAFTNLLPLGGDLRIGAYLVGGRPVPESMRDAPLAIQATVSDGYFATMGIPVVRGRGFEPGDRLGAPLVAVVSEALVKDQFRGEDPLGQTVQPFGDEGPTFRIVGVVRDVRQNQLAEDPRAQLYLPLAQAASGELAVVVRGAADPAQLTAAVRREIHTVDAGLALADVRTMRAVVARSAARPRFIALLLGGFAGCAVVLALVGIYGVVAHSVTQRAGEFGIRAALGARPADVLRDVLGGSLRRAGLGVALGLVGAVAGTRVLARELYGVSPLDPVVLGGTAALLTLVALAASWLPARRATRADPASVLRAD
jgi:putative ABC transport system permease protein